MTWELILDGYSESSYSATPRFAAARLPWFWHWSSVFLPEAL
ncbi:invasion protein [Salmonella enterica]|nr:invasion protein [Salmonella enterica subsp. enterica serovar Agona]